MNEFGVVVFDNPEQLYNQIKATLGDTKIEGVYVEVDPESFNIGYTQALMLMSTWAVYETRNTKILVQPGQVIYDLPEDLLNIVYVYTPDATIPSASYVRAADNQMLRDMFMKFSYLGSNYMINTVYEYMMFYRERGKVFGSFLHWLRRGHKIIIQPTPRSSSYMNIEYSYFRKDLREYSLRERMWIFKYTLAYVKYVLTRKRNKFGAKLPVDEGDYSLEIFQEAQKELEELEKQLMTDFSPIVPPLIG